MRTGERLSRGRPGRASCTLPRQPGLQCTRLILGGLKSVNTVLCGEEHIHPRCMAHFSSSHITFFHLCLSPMPSIQQASPKLLFLPGTVLEWDTGSPYHNSEKMSCKHINKKISGTNLYNNWIRGKGGCSVVRALTAYAEDLNLAPSTHMTTCS